MNTVPPSTEVSLSSDEAIPASRESSQPIAELSVIEHAAFLCMLGQNPKGIHLSTGLHHARNPQFVLVHNEQELRAYLDVPKIEDRNLRLSHVHQEIRTVTLVQTGVTDTAERIRALQSS